MPQWLSQCLCVTPATPLSSDDRVGRNWQSFSPFGRAQRQAVVGQPNVGSPVSALLSHCGPTAIARLVIAPVVDALNCVSRRALAHVVVVLWVRAAAHHVGPSHVLARVSAILGSSVRSTALGQEFRAKASATTHTFLGEMVGSDAGGLSATAPAKPIDAVSGLVERDHKQAAKGHPGQINHVPRHGSILPLCEVAA